MHLPAKIGNAATLLLLAGGFSGFAQQPRVYTAADYAQAEKFLSYNVNPLAWKGVVAPNWMPDGRFWYRAVEPRETTFRIIDPAKKSTP